jgi:formamidopyrimidine-DNA glycosylase
MPELPEVETVVRGLRRVVLRKTIDSVFFNSPKIDRAVAARWSREMAGRKIVDVKRRGKNILLYLSGDLVLWIHLKMTGHLYYRDRTTPPDKHDLMVIHIKNSRHELRFNDYRRFGNIRLLNKNLLAEQKGLKELGPEPLEISMEDFIYLFRRSKRMIKPALLDQSFLAGIGNIYADEALFLAQIHPRKITNRISEKKLGELYRTIQTLLKKAIAKMGTSVDSFAGVDGAPGGFQKYLQAYGREGQPCGRCGAKIRRIKIGSRSSHFCPKCQK